MRRRITEGMSNRQLLTPAGGYVERNAGTEPGCPGCRPGCCCSFFGSAAVIWLAGLLFRPARSHARMGVDSIAVIATYLVGVAGLIALQ
jgi:hypothetical protein